MKNGITRRDALKLSGLTLGGLAVGGAAAGKAGAALGDNPIDPMKRNDLINSLLPCYPSREKLGENEMRITFLGTSFLPRLAQVCNSIFVEVGGGPDGTALDQFVFDCGSGVVAKYNAMGIPMRNINKIFLTHLHGDHMSDLTHIYCFGPAQDRKTPLFVWGPGPSGITDPIETSYVYTDDGLNTFCQRFRDAMRWHSESFSFLQTSYASTDTYKPVKQADWGLPIDPKPIDPTTGPPDRKDSDGYALDGYSLVPIQLDWQKNGAIDGDNVAYNNPATKVKITHYPAVHARKGSISYKLEWNGLSMIFSGDSRPHQETINQANGVTVFIHEMVVPAEIWAAKNMGLRRPPADADTNTEFQQALKVANDVQNSSHTPQGAFGYLLSQMAPPPKLAVATHFQATDDTIRSAFKSIRNHYPKGDVTIAADFMVINVTADKITKRRAVVEDYAWYPLAKIDGQLYQAKYATSTDQIDQTDVIQPGPTTYDESGY